MQLNLRHVISNEILIYPGYVPVPGVNYRVFHYGLEFRVGNWSFDKAKWRHIDVVNKCWAKFPDPPDPSTLDRSNEDSLQRDLFSIECAKSLNVALYRYHERKKCPDPNSLSTPTRETPDPPSLSTPTQKTPDPPSLPSTDRETTSEITASRKFGKVEEIDASRHNSELKNETQELSPPAETNQTFTSMRFWIIGLWAFSIIGFVVVMFVMISSRKGQRKRGKTFKTKRKTSYSGSWDRNAEMS